MLEFGYEIYKISLECFIALEKSKEIFKNVFNGGIFLNGKDLIESVLVDKVGIIWVRK